MILINARIINKRIIGNNIIIDKWQLETTITQWLNKEMGHVTLGKLTDKRSHQPYPHIAHCSGKADSSSC